MATPAKSVKGRDVKADKPDTPAVETPLPSSADLDTAAEESAAAEATSSPAPVPVPDKVLDPAAVGTLLRNGMRAAQHVRNHAPEINQWIKDAAAFVQTYGL